MNLPSTVFSRTLRRKLRTLRLASGTTLDRAARHIGTSISTVSRMENGQASIRRIEAQALCELYGADKADTDLAVSLSEKMHQSPWYSDYGDVADTRLTMYLDLESSASLLRWYEANVIPGLLQCRDYCRALYEFSRPDAGHEEMERLVGLRMDRTKIITRDHGPATLRAVVCESALRRRVGGPEVMASQIAHLERMMQLPNVDVRVLDFDAGAHRGMSQGNLVIMDFADHGPIPTEPTTAYVGSIGGSAYVDGAHARFYEDAFASMWNQALTEKETASLLREVAKEVTA